MQAEVLDYVTRGGSHWFVQYVLNRSKLRQQCSSAFHQELLQFISPQQRCTRTVAMTQALYCSHRYFSVRERTVTIWRLRLNRITFKYPVRTAQETHTVSVIKTSQLMLYREIIAVCSQMHTKHINTLCGQNVEFVSVKPGGIGPSARAV